MSYLNDMIEVRQTETYAKWFGGLRDIRAKARIAVFSETGHTGDTRPVGENVWEFRFTFGPGYRVYYTMRGQALVLLLAGGDKSTQDRDIAKAIALSDEEET
jgi:putative addiction module killer protein